MTNETNTNELIETEYKIFFKGYKENNICLVLKLIETKKWKYGETATFEVYFNNNLKTTVSNDVSMYGGRYPNLKIEDLLRNTIKKDRILKGLLTREFNKQYKKARLKQ